MKAIEAASAPKNDLIFLQNLKIYERHYKEMSVAAMNKMPGHLWYFSQELINMAFFDVTIPLDELK